MNDLLRSKSEQYVAERKAHEATRAVMSKLTSALAESAAHEAALLAALRDATDILADVNHEAVWNGDAVDFDVVINQFDDLLEHPSPRASALLKVAEAARRTVEHGGTQLLADALCELDGAT